MSEKTNWLVTVIYTEVHPIAVEAESKDEAVRLAIETFETKEIKPIEAYIKVEDILQEN